MIDLPQVEDHRARADHHRPDHGGPTTDLPLEREPTRFRHAGAFVVSRFVAMVLVLVAIGAGLTYLGPLEGVRGWDLSVNETLATSRSDRFEEVASFISRNGDTLPVIIFGAVVAIGAALARRWRSAALVPLALLIEVCTFGAVNYIVQRPRPDVETVGAVPSTFSYPSGHVAATLVCWLGLALLLRAHTHRRLAVATAVAAVVTTALMGWARVYLGMHHVLDVVFGVVMGVGALSIAAAALDLIPRSAGGRSGPDIPRSAGGRSGPDIPRSAGGRSGPGAPRDDHHGWVRRY